MSVSASSSGEHAPILTPSGSSGKKRPLRLLKKMLEEGSGKHLLLGLDVSSQFPEGVVSPRLRCSRCTGLTSLGITFPKLAHPLSTPV